MNKIRINEHDLQIIKSSFKRHFHPTDHLWLFGSRVDINQRGGDIDVYIETTEQEPSLAMKKKINFVNELWETLGEQKIDVVLNCIGYKNQPTPPIYQIAKETGIQLL